MRKLIVFNQLSLDGFIADGNGDMSWAHKDRNDQEWNSFVAGNAKGGGELLFGRITYDQMASFWPTPMALQIFPEVAEGMNKLPKVVFSRTLKKATWNNTRLVGGNIAEEVRLMKNGPGMDMVILGSGSIVSQLAAEDLVDEYQCVVNPIVLGAGTSMFGGVKHRISLTLSSSRTFGNGNVLLCYSRHTG